MIDAVLTSDHSPLACGTVKWSQELAKRLGVPCDSIARQSVDTRPLVSVRLSEVGGETPLRGLVYDLLAHDTADSLAAQSWLRWATNVYAANPALAERIAGSYRRDVKALWAPSSLKGDATRGELDILTFGFAHKFQSVHFQKLRDILDASPESYTISLSTGIHEGRSWDIDFTRNMTLMRSIFFDKLRCLGFVADDGLARLLEHVNAAAMFFDPGVRANNTSFWGAMEAGVPVITNLDAGSPPELKHGVNVFNIHELIEWPDADQRRVVRGGAAKVVQQYSWDRLVSVLKAPVHA